MRFSSLSFMGVNFDHTWYNFETLSLMDSKVVPLLKFNKIILLIVRVLTTNATHIISNYYINSGYYNAKCSLIILGGCKCMRMECENIYWKMHCMTPILVQFLLHKNLIGERDSFNKNSVRPQFSFNVFVVKNTWLLYMKSLYKVLV